MPATKKVTPPEGLRQSTFPLARIARYKLPSVTRFSVKPRQIPIMSKELRMSYLSLVVVVTGIFCTPGCVGRTGKVGTPISQRYNTQLASLKLGESTPEDLQKIFKDKKPSLTAERIENNKKVEIWEVARGGNMDAGAFLLWGFVAYDKDQSLLFRFEDEKLVSYESIVHPDPVAPKSGGTSSKTTSPKDSE
jgi:hypothetical protein